MKKYILLILIMPPFFLKSQSKKVLDTIYANEEKAVAIFFPGTIRQGIVGSGNFTFTYNRDAGQYLGLLQATPGPESNLLVISRHGDIFSYVLKYRQELDRLIYFVKPDEKIGNEVPVQGPPMGQPTKSLEVSGKGAFYNGFCAELLSKRPSTVLKGKGMEGITLSLERIIYHDRELYFLVRIKNNSRLEYDINFLGLSVENKRDGKRASRQRIPKGAVYTFRMAGTIGKGETARMVYVAPKFSISREKHAVLELNEQNGERNIALKIGHRHINNPN